MKIEINDQTEKKFPLLMQAADDDIFLAYKDGRCFRLSNGQTFNDIFNLKLFHGRVTMSNE